jgi:ABC-type uncharacterized transport system permease subunit
MRGGGKPRVATLMGVNPNAIITLTFAIGGVFAALAGVMMASNYGNASFSMGFLPGIKALPPPCWAASAIFVARWLAGFARHHRSAGRRLSR